MNELVFLKNKQPVTTSLIIAERTNNQHESVMRLVTEHKAQFERWGTVKFSDLPNGKRDGRPIKIAHLNEQQTLYLLLFMKNTPATIDFKTKLVDQLHEPSGTQTVLNLWINNSSNAVTSARMTKCVYCSAFDNALVKIGVTNNFSRRINAIQTSGALHVVSWCHTDYLPLRDAFATESTLHKRFKAHRVKGEFFNIPYEDAYYALEEHAMIIEHN